MKKQLKNNEEVFLTIKNHWFVIIWTIFLIIHSFDLGFFLIGSVISTIWFIYKILDRNSNFWAVTNHRIIYEYGVSSNNSKVLLWKIIFKKERIKY